MERLLKVPGYVWGGFGTLIMLLFGFGRLRGSLMLKDECRKSQEECRQEIKKSLSELKDLFVSLHEKQQVNIEAVRLKREDDKDVLRKEIAIIMQSIGVMQGNLEYLVKSNKED